MKNTEELIAQLRGEGLSYKEIDYVVFKKVARDVCGNLLLFGVGFLVILFLFVKAHKLAIVLTWLYGIFIILQSVWVLIGTFVFFFMIKNINNPKLSGSLFYKISSQLIRIVEVIILIYFISVLFQKL